MNKLLLILSVLLVAPASAGEAAPSSAGQTAVTVQLSGSAKGVRAMLAGLEKDAVYKEAGCSAKPMKKPAKTAKINCTNANGALLDYLGKNTPSQIRWSISGAAPQIRSASATGVCLRLTCGGVLGCFYKGCQGSCVGC